MKRCHQHQPRFGWCDGKSHTNATAFFKLITFIISAADALSRDIMLPVEFIHHVRRIFKPARKILIARWLKNKKPESVDSGLKIT
jgi:hypothetical protein